MDEEENQSENSESEEGSKLEVNFEEEDTTSKTYKPNPKLVQITPELERFFRDKTESNEAENEIETEAQNEENEDNEDQNGESETVMPVTLIDLIEKQIEQTKETGRMESLKWFQSIDQEFQRQIFRPPRPDLINNLNLSRNKKTETADQDPDPEADQDEQTSNQLGSSHRQLRRAEGWYRKLVELETLGESLDSSRNDLRCHIICPGVTYGFGKGVFSSMLKKLWVEPEERTIPVPSLSNLANILPMIHYQDLATGSKWFISTAKTLKKSKKVSSGPVKIDFSKSLTQRNLGEDTQVGENVMGFYESVFENEWREKDKQFETEEAELEPEAEDETNQNLLGAFDFGKKISEMVRKARKKRRKTSNKDGYVLLWDKDKKSSVGHRLETLIKEIIDINPKDQNNLQKPAILNTQSNHQKIKFEEHKTPYFLPSNLKRDVIFETPFGFRKLAQKIQKEKQITHLKNEKMRGILRGVMADLVLEKNFEMKRSKFLDLAKSARCWEKILETDKERGLKMGELERDGDDGEERETEEGEEGIGEEEQEDEFDVAGKVEWESDPEADEEEQSDSENDIQK